MVNWLKQIQYPASTSSDVFAGDVVNWIIQYHSDIDLAAGDPSGIAEIATETRFRSDKLAMWDLNEDHVITIHSPNYAENKTLNLPTTMAAEEYIVCANSSQELTNKTFSVNLNTLNFSTTNAAGDLLKGNGTYLARFPRGTSLQVLRTNSAGTDVEWGSLDSERVGKATATANGGTAIFNISHGLGVNPTYAFVDCSSHTIARTFTTDSTYIVVTFASPPPSGTVTIYWRVVA